MYCITPAQNQESARLILRGSRASPCCFSAPNQRRSFFLENLADEQMTVDVKRKNRQILILETPNGQQGIKETEAPVAAPASGEQGTKEKEAPVDAPPGPACSQFISYTRHH